VIGDFNAIKSSNEKRDKETSNQVALDK